MSSRASIGLGRLRRGVGAGGWLLLWTTLAGAAIDGGSESTAEPVKTQDVDENEVEKEDDSAAAPLVIYEEIEVRAASRRPARHR